MKENIVRNWGYVGPTDQYGDLHITEGQCFAGFVAGILVPDNRTEKKIGNHDLRGVYAEKLAQYTPGEGGNSYFSFRLGNLWGLVLDCGEDKNDDHPEYGGTICCHAFRTRETAYLDAIIENAKHEYNAPGVEHKIIVSHVPFTEIPEAPFDIEQDTYRAWWSG